MQFTKDLVEAILAGRKTHTRRPAKGGEALVMSSSFCVYKDYFSDTARLKWEVGRTYAVQPGRGKRAVARFLLKNLRQEVVSHITEEDAIAEGFDNREEFFAKWRELYDGTEFDLKHNPNVWVLEFEVVSG
jgi:hypothetical protein